MPKENQDLGRNLLPEWYGEWVNWEYALPPSYTEVELMHIDGCRFGVHVYAYPNDMPLKSEWWWRIPPVNLYYDPLKMSLSKFKMVRSDLDPRHAEFIWNQANSLGWDLNKPLPPNSALSRIQRGELIP